MTNPRQKLENDMCWLLKRILSNEDISQLDQEQMFALYECVKNEYVTGIKIAIMASGRIVSDAMKPRVTKKGLEFLYPDEELLQYQQNQYKPTKTESTESHKPHTQNFYQSSVFWAAAMVIVTILIWVIDRIFPR